jgi:hypothetical protein
MVQEFPFVYSNVDCASALNTVLGDDFSKKLRESLSDPKDVRDLASLCLSTFSLEVAKNSANSASGQYIAAGLSVALVFVATLSAIAAAVFAASAAREARRQARAAWASLKYAKAQADVAQAAYQNLERPYIIETTGEVTEISFLPPFTIVQFENYGRTPGIIVQIAAHLIVSSGPPGDVVLNPSHVSDSNAILYFNGPKKKIKVELSGAHWADDLRRVAEYRASLWLAGEFHYRDMQGEIYAIPFEWEYSLIHKTFLRRDRPANQSRSHPLFSQHIPQPLVDREV